MADAHLEDPGRRRSRFAPPSGSSSSSGWSRTRPKSMAMRRAAERLTAVANEAFGAVRAGVSERDVAAVIEAALGGPATSVRRSTRSSRRGRMRPCRTTGPATGPCTQVTWWCWTLAGSWTDTAPTSLGPCLSASRHLMPPDSMRRFEKRKRRPSRPSDLAERRPMWMPPPARCSSRMDWERRSGTARVMAWGSTSTRNLASRSRGQMSRRCGSSREWSSPSSRARTCPVLAVSGLKTMCW